MVEKILNLIFITIKYASRDAFIFPVKYIDEAIKLTLILAIISFTQYIFGKDCIIDFRALVLNALILILYKFILQKSKENTEA